MRRLLTIAVLACAAVALANVDVLLGLRSDKSYVQGAGANMIAQWGSQIVYAPEGDFDYSVADGKATITAYVGAGGQVNIPPTLGGAMTYIIEHNSFDTETSVTGVRIPDSVTTINCNAFQLCSGLTSLIVGSGVASIPPYAFFSCSALSSVTFAEGLTTIDDRSFMYDSALTSLVIPASLTTFGPYPFYIAGLTKIYFIGNAPSTVDAAAFGGCGATLYRRAGATGWPTVPDAFYGLTTAIWTSYPNPMP